MKIFVLILICFISLVSLVAQDSSISGKATYQQSKVPLASLKISLLDSLESFVQSVVTDKLGNYIIEDIKPGKYSLAVDKEAPIIRQAHIVNGIVIIGDQRLVCNLELTDPCTNLDYGSNCPYCASAQNVLKISPYTIVLYNFNKNKRAIKRYERKRRRKGYETYLYDNQEEIVINMFIDSEYEKFWDLCHSWFCEECKKVF
ncbi:carboxypeptidase-like regulatory domain-containing protein [Saprospiraceae bacterium]|nr:carboxypeptidase-like regulatory domain-containing protein [Saprospiraceae bacterium]